MKDDLTETQVNAVLQALDDALAQGPWDESNFLRVIGKNIKEIRDNLASQLEKDSGAEAEKINREIKRNNQQEVFIALYSSEGNHLQSWERIISNLPRQMISRPIYATEYDVQYLIKSKENKVNEGYVAIFINQDDILLMSPDKTPVDKFGKKLMSLKDRSLNLENVSRFVHLSGTYNFSKGHLTKIS